MAPGAADAERAAYFAAVLCANPTNIRDAIRPAQIARGKAKINWVKWTVVLLLGGLILVTIALVHSDNRLTAGIALGIFSIAAASCVVLIASHNRPFTGEISVGPDLLLQIMPKE